MKFFALFVILMAAFLVFGDRVEILQSTRSAVIDMVPGLGEVIGQTQAELERQKTLLEERIARLQEKVENHVEEGTERVSTMQQAVEDAEAGLAQVKQALESFQGAATPVT